MYWTAGIAFIYVLAKTNSKHLNHKQIFKNYMGGCNFKNLKGLPLYYILLKARKRLHFGFHITPKPTYFQSFSAIIGLLPASNAFVYWNKLAARFYTAPFYRIRSYFDIFLISAFNIITSALWKKNLGK